MRAAGVCVVAVAAGLSLTAGAAATESTITPGVGIGKVKLGMTAAQVKRDLGADYLANGTKTIAGKRYVEYGWNFSHWVVTFAQQGRALRAVQVATDVHDQRTTKGIGYGSTWLKLVHAYPGGRCSWGNHYSPYGFYLEYLVGHEGGTQTLYSLQTDFGGTPKRIVGYSVLEVRVRTAFEPLEEFGPDRKVRCSDDWKDTATPRFLPA